MEIESLKPVIPMNEDPKKTNKRLVITPEAYKDLLAIANVADKQIILFANVNNGDIDEFVLDGVLIEYQPESDFPVKILFSIGEPNAGFVSMIKLFLSSRYVQNCFFKGILDKNGQLKFDLYLGPKIIAHVPWISENPVTVGELEISRMQKWSQEVTTKIFEK